MRYILMAAAIALLAGCDPPSPAHDGDIAREVFKQCGTMGASIERDGEEQIVGIKCNVQPWGP